MPDRLKKALAWIDTPVVAAHWGGQNSGAQVLKELCGIEHLYMDTAYGYGTIVPQLVQKIIEKHGADKILFASDAPWNRPSQDAYVVECLQLTEEEKEQIYWKNALKLLGGN
jgi:predicted TIM-barrel fold metal-dependent hydrolase